MHEKPLVILFLSLCLTAFLTPGAFAAKVDKKGKPASKKPAKKKVDREGKPDSQSADKKKTASETVPPQKVAPLPTYFDPTVKLVYPKGGQRGSRVTLTIRGDRLNKPLGITTHTHPSIVLTQKAPSFFKLINIKSSKPEISQNGKLVQSREIKATIDIHPHTPPGEHIFRLHTEGGLTHAFAFFVSPYPTVVENKKNKSIETAQLIDVTSPITVEGHFDRYEADYYEFKLNKDERIAIEVESLRLGTVFLDPVVTIHNQKGEKLFTADDHPLTGVDPSAHFQAPEDGTYKLAIHENDYLGGSNYHYRMHIGPFTSVPTIWKTVSFSGDTTASPTPPWFSQQTLTDNQQLSPSLLPKILKTHKTPAVYPVQATQNLKAALKTEAIQVDKAVTLAGKIEKLDSYFHVHLEKGEWRFQVHGQSIGTEIDSVLSLWSTQPKPKVVKSNDDSSGSMDSLIIFNIKKSGSYLLLVRDNLVMRSRDKKPTADRDLRYLLSISRTKPKVNLKLAEIKQYSQDQNRVIIPQGGRTTLWLNIEKEKFSGEISATVEAIKNGIITQLPQGVHCKPEVVSSNQNKLALHFYADSKAKIHAGLMRITPKLLDKKTADTAFLHRLGLIYANPNNHLFHHIDLIDVAYSITPPVPFDISIDKIKAPLVHNGVKKIRVTAKRKAGFKGPINVIYLNPPSGVSGSGSKTIPADQSHIDYVITANDKIKAQQVHLHLQGSASIGPAKSTGIVRLSSNAEVMELKRSIYEVKLTNTAIHKGNTGQLKGRLNRKSSHSEADPPAIHLHLKNIPAHIKVLKNPITLKPGQDTFAFDLKVTEKARMGIFKTLLIELVYEENGQEVIQRTGRGSILRITNQKTQITRR